MNAYFSLFCIFMDIFLQHSHRLAQYEFIYIATSRAPLTEAESSMMGLCLYSRWEMVTSSNSLMRLRMRSL